MRRTIRENYRPSRCSRNLREDSYDHQKMLHQLWHSFYQLREDIQNTQWNAKNRIFDDKESLKALKSEFPKINVKEFVRETSKNFKEIERVSDIIIDQLDPWRHKI